MKWLSFLYLSSIICLRPKPHFPIEPILSVESLFKQIILSENSVVMNTGKRIILLCEKPGNFKTGKCGCELNDSNRTLDHYMPLWKGVANIKENVVACCFGCNNKKGSKTYEEFMKLIWFKTWIV